MEEPLSTVSDASAPPPRGLQSYGNFVLLVLVCAFSADPELQVRANVVLNAVPTVRLQRVNSTPRSLCLA